MEKKARMIEDGEKLIRTDTQKKLERQIRKVSRKITLKGDFIKILKAVPT